MILINGYKNGRSVFFQQALALFLPPLAAPFMAF
jgi:hypothetical protein